MYLELWACEANKTPNQNNLDDENFEKCAKKVSYSFYLLITNVID